MFHIKHQTSIQFIYTSRHIIAAGYVFSDLVTNLEFVYASLCSCNSLKGKEILVEAEEEQDGNNGSPWVQPPPEMLEAEEALEWLKVCAAGYAISEFSVIW